MFRRQLKAYQSQPSGSAGIGFIPRSKHFFALQFLGGTFEATSSISNLDLREEELIELNKENDDVNVHDDDFMILDSVSY